MEIECGVKNAFFGGGIVVAKGGHANLPEEFHQGGGETGDNCF